jgi:hypothetical protein
MVGADLGRSDRVEGPHPDQPRDVGSAGGEREPEVRDGVGQARPEGLEPHRGEHPDPRLPVVG